MFVSGDRCVLSTLMNCITMIPYFAVISLLSPTRTMLNKRLNWVPREAIKVLKILYYARCRQQMLAKVSTNISCISTKALLINISHNNGFAITVSELPCNRLGDYT